MHVRVNNGKHLDHKKSLHKLRLQDQRNLSFFPLTISLPTPDLERSPKRQSPREGHALSGSIDGVQFSPEFTWDRVLRQFQRLCEPLRTCDTDNRGGYARIAERELQG